MFMVCLILVTMTLMSCAPKTTEAIVQEQLGQMEFILKNSSNKSIPTAPNNAETYISGTINGGTSAQYDSLRFVGYWGSPITVNINVSTGRKNIKCWYKQDERYVRFYPSMTMKVVTPEHTTYIDLLHVVVRDTLLSDQTGYSSHMYYDMATEFILSFNQYGLTVNPLENSAPFVNTKIEYSGIADPAIPWPDGVNASTYNEIGSSVVAGEQLYIISTYNDLRGDRKIPMSYNSTTGKWEFEFPYLPTAGMNFRIEKASGQPLFMGVRLITPLGSVSCYNIHYFPDSSGQNTWMLFEASLVNGIPHIPYPGVNQLLNILQLIIGE